MSGLSSAIDPVYLGPPTLRYICLIGAPKVQQLGNSYIALTQPHVDRLHSDFTRWYSMAEIQDVGCFAGLEPSAICDYTFYSPHFLFNKLMQMYLILLSVSL